MVGGLTLPPSPSSWARDLSPVFWDLTLCAFERNAGEASMAAHNG